MKFKKLAPAIIMLGTIIPFAPAAQAAEMASWYGGIGVGEAKANDFSASELNTSLASAGITATGTTVDDSDTGWKLFGGYQFNQYFALEGAYTDLGKGKFSTTVTAVNGSAVTPTPVNGSFRVKDGFYLDAVGILPIYDNFSVFGKAGVYSIKAELTAAANGVYASASDRSSDWTYGAGLNYDITKNIGIRGEWERFQKVGDPNTTGQSDIDLLSVGLLYKFN